MRSFIFLIIFAALSFGVASADNLRHRKLLTTPKNPIVGSYIVQLKPGFKPRATATKLLNNFPNVKVTFYYRTAINGFLMNNFPAEKLRNFLKNPEVKLVEQNSKTFTTEEQLDPTWGLDRIDDRAGLDQSYTYNMTGKGVHAYVLDTNIADHDSHFGRRLVDCVSFSGEPCSLPVTINHGTHVAGTIGSRVYGVAKRVILHAVPVLRNDGGGDMGTAIAGIDHVASIKKSNPSRKMVANMSLIGGKTTSCDEAINNAVNLGVVFVVAAGNFNEDSCTYSPSGAASAITVGAVDNTDMRASFSNFGTCVDIFAPGVAIESVSAQGGTLSLSGTSMSSPHVAGVMALYLQAGKTTSNMITDSTKGEVGNPSGSPNRLLYSGSLVSRSAAVTNISPVTAPASEPVLTQAP